MKPAVLAALLLGCGAAPTPVTSSTDASAPGAPICGSLGSMVLADTPTSVLDGHLQLRMPSGAARVASGRALLGPRRPDALETQLEVTGVRQDELRVIVMELFRRPGEDLTAEVARWLGREESLVEALAVAEPMDGVFVVAGETSSAEGMTLVGRAVVETLDGTLSNLSFFVTRAIVDAEGVTPCASFARRIAETVTAGERRVEADGGLITLNERVSIRIDVGYTTFRQPGRDFEVYYFYPLNTLDSPHAQLGVYLGNEPSSHVRDVLEMRSAAGAMLGQSVEWHVWTTARSGRRVTHMEAMVEVPGGDGEWAHAFLVAEDPEEVDALKAMAETLSIGAPTP